MSCRCLVLLVSGMRKPLGACAPRGFLYVWCGGVLLSHTLSSAVPSPRPGLSFRVRKGTGRLTWAMTTAKPIQRSDGNHRTGGTGTTPRFRSWRSGNRTTDASKTLHRYRHRDHKKQHSLPSNERNHHRTRPNPPQRKGLESVPRSPVSTGRLHPSRGFHVRPIDHVFCMGTTGTRRFHGMLILEQASRLDAFSGYPSRT